MLLAPRARTCAESLPVAALCEVNHFSRYGHVKSLNLFRQIKFYQKVNAKTHETTENFTDLQILLK